MGDKQLPRDKPVLWTVNVNTGAASAVLTVYDGPTVANPSTTGSVVAMIDASSKSSQVFGVQVTNGLYLVMTGGNADVTVGYR